ncbi:glutaminyl-peptide cyclotransferase [Flavobacterium silvaticum]|uniref:Glutaminyl-peptide cyclotransferase n=1 Tax=Flavobacterium silvaticum TaxID=1852020 RepID=A0A972JIY8_9FLAO|nr:glutaminyl-peptide cyclotransferase [Flavobacterium silvaticum]NMH28798.1 glutaminyl-peptide cyclotransferase [Flavobacterium silvaticum]
MSSYKLLTTIGLGLLLGSCGKDDPKEKFFSFNESNFKTKYKKEDSVTLELTSLKDKAVDSVVYFVNDKKAASVKGLQKTEFALKDVSFGYQKLKALVYFDGETSGQEIDGRIEVVSSIEPKLLSYKVLNTYPHDVAAFTEGLEFYRDTLMESTGQKGASWIRKSDFRTAKPYKQVDLTPEYFGEGITVIGGKIYQLTYQEKTGFVYNADTMKKEKEFTYDKDIEGWGMTNDGKYIYASDGTEKIWRVDPATQKHLDYVNVYSQSGKIQRVNELEFVNGKLYGNIWQQDAIALIDPVTGAVEGILNLADLRKELKAKEAEVLNGIAYRKSTGTFFVTGKNWDKLFEISISN